SGASTSSATGAWGGIIVVAIRASTRQFRVKPSRGTFALLDCPATISTGPGTNGWPARSDATSVAVPTAGRIETEPTLSNARPPDDLPASEVMFIRRIVIVSAFLALGAAI